MTARAWLLFAAVSVVWGVPYFFIKVAVEAGVPPAFVAWSRVALVCRRVASVEDTTPCARATAAWYCAGSIWSKNWPRLTRSPSRTAMSMMRPVMSALMSTEVFASILPLAVTELTRSRRPTCSSRTSVAACRCLLIRNATMPPTARSTTAAISQIRDLRDMSVPR